MVENLTLSIVFLFHSQTKRVFRSLGNFQNNISRIHIYIMTYYNTLFQLQNYKIKIIHTNCISVSKTLNQSMIIIFSNDNRSPEKGKGTYYVGEGKRGPRFSKVEWKRRWKRREEFRCETIEANNKSRAGVSFNEIFIRWKALPLKRPLIWLFWRHTSTRFKGSGRSRRPGVF